MHSLEEILKDTRENGNLCKAVEKGDVVCFKEKKKGKKYCSKHASRYFKYGIFELPKKEIKRCKFIDCDKTYNSNGYCKNHAQLYRNRKKEKRIKIKHEALCCVAECNNNIRIIKSGLCNKHYLRFIIHGDVNIVFKQGCNTPSQRKHFKCIAKDCNKTYKDAKLCKGLCNKHYHRWRKFKDYNIKSEKEYKEKLKGKQNAIQKQSTSQGIMG